MKQTKHYHKTFDDAAAAALKKITKISESTLGDRNKFKPIETFLCKWINTLHNGVDDMESDIELATSVIERAGVEALNWFKETNTPFNNEEMLTLLCSKQHDYGHKNITNFGTIGVAIRVCDKIARIQNLENSGVYKNESLLDSYLDIIGYALIAVMLNENSFQLQLKTQQV
jgi:hypothetical protein